MNRKLLTLCAVLLACGLCAVARAQSDPDITDMSATTETPFTKEVVTFTATATSAAGPVTYTWSFDDGTPDVVGQTVQHAFAAEDTYVVMVKAFDGVNLATDLLLMDAIAPPAETDPDGVDLNALETDPDSGLEVSVVLQKSGVVQLALNDANLTRAGRASLTDFGDGSDDIGGTKPRHEYKGEGLFIATTKLVESGSEVAKIRKQLTVSSDQAGAPRRVANLPGSRKISVGAVKGKFNFGNASKNDTVSVTFSIELPEGLDLSVSQPTSIAVGNIAETVDVDPKGRGSQIGRFKKVSIKFPKLAKGTTATAAGQMAKVTVQMSAADLDSSGFDTEGVTARAASAAPKIQFSMLLGGVSYSDEAEVAFKVSKDGDTGILTRSGRP
jgi:hypothetical protein